MLNRTLRVVTLHQVDGFEARQPPTQVPLGAGEPRPQPAPPESSC